MILLGGVVRAQDPPVPAEPDKLSTVIRQNLTDQAARLDALRSELARQDQQLAQLKRALAAQEAEYHALRHAVGLDVLDQQRGGNVGAGGRMSTALPMPDTAPPVEQSQQRPVGRAPERDERPPEVAPIFDQPGVLTARGKLVVEPSYQFAYSSNERVALIGYTVIPAVLIGLVDARQVKTTTQTGALALRYGVSNRMELELRIPYVYGHTDTISREIFTGSATDKVFTAHGHGIGDIEATARYQMNDGGADRPYYIGWVRVKSRTGKDPFEVTTDCVSRCVQNTTGTGLPLELPQGSGFYSVQPGLTWLFPSDPVVFFGNVSYL
ncbi:MAG: acetate kinase, partial [Lysobacterales bacterium 13-68-4]